MKLEHFAVNVAEPFAVSEWYVKHLGLTIVRRDKTAPFMTFLADDSGRIMIELYNNPPNQVPDYKTMHPLILHIAFVTTDPEEDKNKLLAAGATLQSEQKLEDGSVLIMLKDPWGFSLQLCKRAIPMLAPSERDFLNRN
jgi:glyoxylase I family protein